MFGAVCGSTRGTYSSQNEMICDILAGVPAGGISRHKTHIVCEPVVLESLHVLSCHCQFVSRQFLKPDSLGG